MSRQVALALVLATLWGSESLAQSAAPVAKVRYLSNFQVAPRFGDRPESALCSRWLTTRRMGEDANIAVAH